MLAVINMVTYFVLTQKFTGEKWTFKMSRYRVFISDTSNREFPPVFLKISKPKFYIDDMVYMPYYIGIKYTKEAMYSMFQVEFYEKEDGDIPVENFLNSLDVKMRNKILMILNVLQEKGNQLREPYSKHLDDGIFEIHRKIGNDISRVLYFFYYNGKIIITNGFI